MVFLPLQSERGEQVRQQAYEQAEIRLLEKAITEGWSDARYEEEMEKFVQWCNSRPNASAWSDFSPNAIVERFLSGMPSPFFQEEQREAFQRLLKRFRSLSDEVYIPSLKSREHLGAIEALNAVQKPLNRIEKQSGPEYLFSVLGEELARWQSDLEELQGYRKRFSSYGKSTQVQLLNELRRSFSRKPHEGESFFSARNNEHEKFSLKGDGAYYLFPKGTDESYESLSTWAAQFYQDGIAALEMVLASLRSEA